jgi:sugar phosphate isomerase/epimerase
VREAMAQNPGETLRKIAEMGYKEIEPFGFDAGRLFGLSIPEFAKTIEGLGMSMPSAHGKIKPTDYDAKTKSINDAAKQIIDNAAQVGLKYLIVPYLDDQERKDIPLLVNMLQSAGAYANKAGVKLAYHNHDFEFTTKGPDGRKLIEWILQEVPGELLSMQMDIYWVEYAKEDPCKYFSKYPGRWKLCHVKDMADTPERQSIEVGQGTLDFNKIFKKRKKAGLEHFVVELEHYKTTPLEGIDQARKGLLKLWE